MHKIFNPLISGVKHVAVFCLNQRVKYLEFSREKWKQKAMKRLDEIRALKHQLEVTQSELKKIDDQ